jgi:hypothetical protein
MLMSFNYGLRAMTYNLLGMGKDVKAAEYALAQSSCQSCFATLTHPLRLYRDLFNFLLGVPPPMMLISIHGLTQGDYVLIKTAVGSLTLLSC